jgi:hypothetical protein
MKDFNQLCCEKCWHTTEKPVSISFSAAQKDLCHQDKKCEHEITSQKIKI